MISENLKNLLTDEILAAAPLTEPERQHYFIDRVRAYAGELKSSQGKAQGMRSDLRLSDECKRFGKA